MLFTVNFWKDAAERAIKTFCQALVAVLAVGVPIWEMNWKEAIGLALTATMLSLITSVASGPIANRGTASMVDESNPPKNDK